MSETPETSQLSQAAWDVLCKLYAEDRSLAVLECSHGAVEWHMAQQRERARNALACDLARVLVKELEARLMRQWETP